MAQTSDRVSSIAARYAGVTADEMLSMTASHQLRQETAAEIRSMAASLLRQDEVKGVRKLLKKITGR
jgi:ribonuclease HIII